MTKFLRLPAVIERTGLSRSTIYEMVDRGDFPKPVKIGARAIAWPSESLETWAAERMEKRLMQKRRPGEGGADLQSGDRRNPTKPRPILQASPAARMRLAALQWGRA